MTWEAAHRAYKILRDNVRKKRVPFEITFQDFVEAWGDQWSNRGRLHMYRKVREMGYVPGNLAIGPRRCV